MEDLFKKFVNAGVGYIAQGSKSVQKTIDKLVQDNKMTQEEGKKIVDDLLKSGETKRAELEKQFQGLADSVKKTVGLGDSKGKATAKKPASSTTSKAAGATKKAADKVSDAAGSAQKSAAAKAGAAKPAAAKKPAAKKPAASAAGAGSEDQA
jgi:polyhydroxyalkanoate synthesis regulator phasin